MNEALLTADERDYVHRLKSVTYAQLEEETREAKADVAKYSKDLIRTVRDQYDAFMYYNSAEHGVLLKRANAFPIAMRRSKTMRRRSSSGVGAGSRRSSSHSILRKFKAKYDGAVGIRNNAEQWYVTALKRYFILLSFRDLGMAKNMYRRAMLDLSDNILEVIEDWADQRKLNGRTNIVDRRRNYDNAVDSERRRFEEIRQWAEAM